MENKSCSNCAKHPCNEITRCKYELSVPYQQWIPIPTPNKMIEVEQKLIGQFDAKIWAEEFVKAVRKKPSIATDEGTMIEWFANAIMAGYDHQDLAQEIARQDLIPRKDAVKYVKIDEENINEIFSEDGAYSYEDIGEILRRIRTCNPLKLKQQGESNGK